MRLSDEQIQRYARHVLLPDVGGVGQARLLDAAVRVDDAGLAGSAALVYLAAAGVGTLIVADEAPVADGDVGFLYEQEDVGRPRREAATRRIAALNPDVRVAEGVATNAVSLRTNAVRDAAPALAEGAAAAARVIRAIARGEVAR